MEAPMVLDFLARLLGLGNVSEAIQGILKRIRKPIDDLIARIIKWLKHKIKSFGGQKGKKGKNRF